MKIKPYVSIDLEFTGLNIDQAQILEIGAVYDDGIAHINDLPTFHAVIHYDKFNAPELIALVMNSKLLKEINDLTKEQKETCKPETVLIAFGWWLEGLCERNPETGKLERLTVAGKNAAGADIPVLKNNCKANGVPDITSMFTHRTLDVGSMYFDVFGENVTLGKINELTGRDAVVSHRALDDAWDVVYAIRHKMSIAQKRENLRKEFDQMLGDSK